MAEPSPGHRAIWIELHDSRGRSGQFERALADGKAFFTAIESAEARAYAAQCAAQYKGEMLVHDDGEYLAFAIFCGVSPTAEWRPNVPPTGRWMWDEAEYAFRPEWSEATARELIGAKVLVGTTKIFEDGRREQTQFHGHVISCDADKGIIVECEGHEAGRTRVLPPCTNIWQRANPEGRYRLRSTGEEIGGVHFTAIWSLQPASVRGGFSPPNPAD